MDKGLERKRTWAQRALGLNFKIRRRHSHSSKRYAEVSLQKMSNACCRKFFSWNDETNAVWRKLFEELLKNKPIASIVGKGIWRQLNLAKKWTWRYTLRGVENWETSPLYKSYHSQSCICFCGKNSALAKVSPMFCWAERRHSLTICFFAHFE